MAVCPGTSCESLSAKCCAKAWSIGGRLDRGRNFFTDFTMISHSPNFSWWLGKPWADASYNMMYCYVSCCCSCSFLGQCGMSIVCRWISGVTTRPISLHLLVPILVPPGMHWSSPMVIPCSTLLAHTCPISSPNPSHTAIGIMGKSHCSLMFTVHHSRLPREKKGDTLYIYIYCTYIFVVNICKYIINNISNVFWIYVIVYCSVICIWIFLNAECFEIFKTFGVPRLPMALAGLLCGPRHLNLSVLPWSWSRKWEINGSGWWQCGAARRHQVWAECSTTYIWIYNYIYNIVIIHLHL